MLWQQLFWFFGHPWVYIIFLPATGMISMIMPVFSRRPIVGYTWVAVRDGLHRRGRLRRLGAPHVRDRHDPDVDELLQRREHDDLDLQRGAGVRLGRDASGTGARSSRPRCTSPSASSTVFVIGGLNGIVTAVIPFDWQLTDTYFVVAHLHYVLVGANMLPVFAAFYYWLPKMTGRMLDERLGQVELLDDVHRLQRDVLPDAHPGAARHAAPHLHVSGRDRLGQPATCSRRSGYSC